MSERVDILIVGAGPAGSTAARIAAQAGCRVLLVERRRCVGLPVQCAEHVPAQIAAWAPLPEGCIAQRVDTLRTLLPDGATAETASPGCILQRALFDKALAVAACAAGAELWTEARALERTEHGALIRRRGQAVEVACRILIGADGPQSTVGRWIGQCNQEFVETAQVEVALPQRIDAPAIYFDAAYPGGYGWLFPKGETANVGAGVDPRLGGRPVAALAHMLRRLEGQIGPTLGRTGGFVPAGGPLPAIVVGNAALAGDAAGHTHAITGAGIFAAVVDGTLVGQAAARAIQADDIGRLAEYEGEWAAWMGHSLRHAAEKRRRMGQQWSSEPAALSALIRQSWIAFKEYRQPTAEAQRTQRAKPE